MSRKGENIYKRKDGRWEGRYMKFRNKNGSIHYGYIYAKSYSEVKAKLREFNSTQNTISSTSKVETSFEKIIYEWLANQKCIIKESTYARYYQLATTHLIPSLGSIRLKEINSPLIIGYIEFLLQSGRLDGKGGLATKTVKDISSVIKCVFQYAKQNEYISLSSLDLCKIKQNNSKVRVLSFYEQEKLTDTLLHNTDLCKYGVLLSLYTGIRLGELCALKWENINLLSGVLTITKTMQRVKDVSPNAKTKTKIIITDPKSESSKRDIPMPIQLLDLTQQFYGETDSFVLTGKKNNYVEPRTMQYRFKSLIEQSNIDYVNYHVLRHTFATRCIELGFEIKALSEILGHSSVNVTLNRYVHSSLESKKINMNKILIRPNSPSES